MSVGNCYICGAIATHDTDWAVKGCSCKRCGDYRFNATEFELKANDAEERVRLSGWVRQQNDAGLVPTIDLKTRQRIRSMPLPRIRARALAALARLKQHIPRFGDWFTPAITLDHPDLLAISYCDNGSDFEMILALMELERLVIHKTMWMITITGLITLEDTARSGSNFSQGFVAMSFSPGLNDAWTNGFDPAIRSSGFSPMRIDAKEYVGGISDEIISEIRRSRFAIADYTEQKNGVYFEAGFALGVGIVVIPTVRAVEVSKLHFDIKHLNTLLWDNPADLADKLAKRIKAVVGIGPNVLAS